MGDSKTHYCLVESHDYVKDTPKTRTLAFKFRSERGARDWKCWYEICKRNNCNVRRKQHPKARVDGISVDLGKMSMSASLKAKDDGEDGEEDDQS